jgi:hypothetical protein
LDEKPWDQNCLKFKLLFQIFLIIVFKLHACLLFTTKITKKNIIIIEEKNIQLLDKKMEQFNLMLILSDFEGNPWNPAKHDPFLVWNFIRGIGIGLLGLSFWLPIGMCFCVPGRDPLQLLALISGQPKNDPYSLLS